MVWGHPATKHEKNVLLYLWKITYPSVGACWPSHIRLNTLFSSSSRSLFNLIRISLELVSKCSDFWRHLGHILSQLLPWCLTSITVEGEVGPRLLTKLQVSGHRTGCPCKSQRTSSSHQSCQSKVRNCKAQFECARSTTIVSEHHCVDGEVKCALSNVFDLSQTSCFILTHRWKTSVCTSEPWLWPAGESRTSKMRCIQNKQSSNVLSGMYSDKCVWNRDQKPSL